MCLRRVVSSFSRRLRRVVALGKLEVGLNETTSANLSAPSRLTNKVSLAESASELSAELKMMAFY